MVMLAPPNQGSEVARRLPRPLLEIVFGVAWPWLAGHGAPATHVLVGGLVVVVALAVNEALALRGRALRPLEA